MRELTEQEVQTLKERFLKRVSLKGMAEAVASIDKGNCKYTLLWSNEENSLKLMRIGRTIFSIPFEKLSKEMKQAIGG